MSDQRKIIQEYYESCFRKYGDSHLGVNWPKAEDALKRYEIMLDLIAETPKATLLDFGCGAGHLLDFLRANPSYAGIEYVGLDVSPEFIDLCRKKHPGTHFECLDILKNAEAVPEVDFAVLNGVFTVKASLSFDEMSAFMSNVLTHLWPKVRQGLAFNVMSKHVDWERDDLFHLPFDQAAEFVRKELSRNFSFRQDYGLFEYTCYVLRDPKRLR